MDLSVLIPARNEIFLEKTVFDVLQHAKGETEVIAVLDGAWPIEPIPDHPRLTLIHHSVSVGQRAAMNEAARLSRAKYVMKLDAHCSVAEGFDVELVKAAAEVGEDATQIPAQFNLHAFDWVCDSCQKTRIYQGPTPKECPCGNPAFRRDMIWQPRKSRLTTAWRFDSDLHFQYWREYQRRPEAQCDLPETMSCLGACFFMSRERYWQLGGMDEEHGSWGQMGTEVGCKSWLSGGRMVTNRRTWFAHMFRTQGGDFGFPFPFSRADVERARKRSRDLWIGGSWPGQVRPLSWLIEHFAPVPDWPGEEEKTPPAAPAIVAPAPSDLEASCRAISKGIVYYSDCRGDEAILQAARTQLRRATNGHRIAAVTLAPLKDHFDRNIVLSLEPGVLTMFRQILTGLEALDVHVAFLCEHDVLYHPSHFDFVPPRDDVYYYNENTWKVDAISGRALFYYTKQTSGLCASRDLLVEHYRKRVERVQREGYDRRIGYEPGAHRLPRGVDDHPAERWMAASPNVDIRHAHNLTRNRWRQDQFRDKRTCQGWTMADEVPAWGRTRGRFADWLREVTS